ncbi:trypsin-like peptidase domain-containing protein [Cognataquiflexum rubidum]|uniref:trypsin-like peptidase domain-containing protein n=1 Tax=Cognataquiflexum rubidum TaxID=2922273 RepID=UPI001F148A51|nr:trypsin-like peptidase domain-containing protein [Cognataquiflexum rubidum]MCH6234947.1 trypsin-like peptidase domain-containing protein [Cognataquiflexum rubidum]
MNKKQFFLGIILASLIGGVIALAGASYLFSPNSATNFTDKQNTSLVNSLSDEKFNVPDGINFVASAAAVTPAVVHVKSSVTVSQSQRGSDPFEEFFGFRNPEREMQPREAMSSGSGVIISEDGYIVTNNHVIENATKIDISLEDNTRYTARVIGTDPTTDLALLKIEAKGLRFVKFGDSDRIKVGEWVLAVGNPFDLTSTVTAGIISAKARNIGILRDLENNLQVESFLQTDAVVNRGNSGGALVNLGGELIGINTAIASNNSSGTFTGYAFAVPSSIVKKVMDDLLEYGAVQRGLLGVQIQDISRLDENLSGGLTTSRGVYVIDVNKGGGGEEAGLKSGDVIIGIDGVETNNVAKLQEMVARKRPGDKVEIKYLRNGKEAKATGMLKNISGDTNIVKVVPPKIVSFNGVTFEDIKGEMKERLSIEGGAGITSVEDDNWRKSGAKPGFIITSVIGSGGRYKITNSEQLVDVLKDNVGEEIVILGLYPNGQEYYFEIKIE